MTAATLAVVGFNAGEGRHQVVQPDGLRRFRRVPDLGLPAPPLPEAVDLVASGRVEVLPFTRKVPMDDVNDALAQPQRVPTRAGSSSFLKGSDTMEFVDHDLAPDRVFTEIGYEEKRGSRHAGNPVDGLHAVWITLDNPE